MRRAAAVADASRRRESIRSRAIDDEEPQELWHEPWEGLPEDEAAWEWDLVDWEENGPTTNPPNRRRGWKRHYFVYHEPSCTNIKISADRDPESGKWFNPHRSSGRPRKP